MKDEKNKQKRLGLGCRGVSLTLAVVAVVSLLVYWGVIVNNILGDYEVVKRTARETAAITLINDMEFAKRGLQAAVPYSFYQASADVLDKGGFCWDDDCKGKCKIPEDTPSFECEPWWRVYSNEYAPEYGIPFLGKEMSEATFGEYLANRTSSIFNGYSKMFGGPDYCPMPPGSVGLEDGGSVRVSIDNVDGGVIRKREDEFEVVESLVNFTGSAKASTLKIFLLGRGLFIENDGIRDAFIDADGQMENECSEMEMICENGVKEPVNSDCREKKDDYEDLECQYKNEDTCKEMVLGDVCKNDMMTCEELLDNYCCKDVPEGTGDDYNGDGKLDADERYNRTVKEAIQQIAIDNSVGGLDLIISDPECIKVGHTAEMDKGEEISCTYEEIGNGADDPCCQLVKVENCCGCKDECGEDDCPREAVCDPDTGCPFDIKECPEGSCGDHWSCTDVCEERECLAPCVVQECEIVGYECPADCMEGCPPCDLVPIEECEDVEYDTCGEGKCDWGPCTEYSCDFELNCKTNVCGYNCCKETYAVIEDASCTFEYFGTANVSVNIASEGEYSFGNSKSHFSMPFRLASGNADGCDDIGPDEESEACCTAATDDECKPSEN